MTSSFNIVLQSLLAIADNYSTPTEYLFYDKSDNRIVISESNAWLTYLKIKKNSNIITLNNIYIYANTSKLHVVVPASSDLVS